MYKTFIISVLLSLSFAADIRSSQREEFDYLLMAQFWPPTSCYIFFGSKNCTGIPAGVDGFTLHGLWPSNPGEKQPFYCNDTDKFDYNKIEDLSSQLAVEWPNYDMPSGKDALWAHEWTKHGTCAGSIPALKGEANYFNTTLQVHKLLDVVGVLAKRGLVPSRTTYYYMQDFFNALRAAYGVNPSFVCQPSNNKYYIEQVYICFTKQFKLMDCPASQSRTNGDPRFDECPQQGKTRVLYLPIEKEQAHPKERVIYFESERIDRVIEWEETEN